MTATTGKIETGVVDIRGKQYQTVALRVQMFREKHPDYSLVTEVIERDPECVVMKAIIGDASGRVIATGHSEEYRKASQINRTSALENAETSAIGRALAALGFGGTEFATANEVANAIHQQAGGGQSNKAQSASPEPEAYTFPSGPAKGITEMKAMARALWREIEGCGDQSELNPLLDIPENKALLKQMSLLENPAHREIWEGDGKDNPGIAGLITRKGTDFAQHIAALART